VFGKAGFLKGEWIFGYITAVTNAGMQRISGDCVLVVDRKTKSSFQSDSPKYVTALKYLIKKAETLEQITFKTFRK